ncbi:side tail fiber protein of prophage [Escherichia coli]|nr:side tail fiber protein of prophage [Escherichia coli]
MRSCGGGLSVVVPTTDYIVGQTTYKWGATNPKAECIAVDIIIDLAMVVVSIALETSMVMLQQQLNYRPPEQSTE